MSETPTKLIVDCSTGIETIIPLTQEELEERALRQSEFEQSLAANIAAEEMRNAAKASAEAKLAALGLTPEEIAAL